VFKNPSPAFLKILAESGPVPGVDDKKRKAEAEDMGARKKTVSGWTGKPADMERLAAAIEQLEENDLLPVVRIIMDNQTPDMYVKSSVEGTYSPILVKEVRANQARR
jgi:transcription initiation factor TFIID/TFIIF subunit